MDGKKLALWGVLVLGFGGAQAAPTENSCLIGSKMKDRVTAGRIEEADPRFSVLRPCQGQVKQGEVEVIYSVGDGVTLRSRVGTASSIQSQISAVEKRPLVDIWPSRSFLAAAMAFAQGKRASTAGLSGFDGANGALPVQGDVVAVPGLKLHLRLHGLNPEQAIRFSQSGWVVDMAPVQGVVDFPVDKLKPGPLQLAQGGKSVTLTVLGADDVTDVLRELGALSGTGGSPAEVSVRRAVLFQENELGVNALSEMMSAKGE